MKKFFSVLKKIEIKMYIITTSVFLLLIITALTVYYDTKKEEKNFFDVVEKHGNSIITMLSPDIILYLNNIEKNETIIQKKIMDNKEINYFKIINEKYEIILSTKKEEIGTDVDMSEIYEVEKTNNPYTRVFLDRHGKRIFEITAPIIEQPEQTMLGKIVLGISMDEIHMVVNATRYKLIALGFSLFMLGGAGIIFNISYYSYRNVQKTLENVKSYTSSILLSMDVGVIATDLFGKISIVNNAIKKILAIEDLISKNIFNVFQNRSEITEIFQEAISNFHGIETKEMQYTFGDKSKFLRITTSILKNHENIAMGLVVLVEDVTDIKELERQVYRADKVTALGRLASGIAHEIKNPLSAMNINVQLVEEDLINNKNIDDESRERLLRYISVINSETNRLEEIIRNFIDFTKTTSLKKEIVSLKNMIFEQVLNLIEPEATRRGVKVIQKINIDPYTVINCDRNKIKQLLLNLIINSLQAMPAGGDLTIAINKISNSMVIEIEDTGIGIRKEDYDKIFDLYYTTKKSGSGLGLSISQRIIEEHNGTIEFTSEHGKGTKFTVKLPMQEG
ncbi:PAS domain S-box protein [Candidatus Poribacteria bacterium]|nr:PAS domain S-box protein [Candidatus Poribacteria bacterium]